MTFLKFAASIIAVATLAGCAHPLMITPNATKIVRDADSPPRLQSKVGYYFNDALRSEQITSAGGGGDKVTTVPYRDIETGLYIMLSNVFEGVTRLKAPADQEAIRSNGISYVITPEIQVTSSSSSMLTWPPTHFNVDLKCDIADASGHPVESAKVVGQGDAEFDEFKADFALSGKRATEDALRKMQRKLLEMKLTPKSAQVTAGTAPSAPLAKQD